MNLYRKSAKDINTRILDILCTNTSITQVEISYILGVSLRTVKKNMNDLVDNGVIERVGSSRKGY